MHIRPMAAASALVLAGAVGLSACSGGSHSNASPASSPAISAPTATGGQPDGSIGSTSAAQAASQSPAISDTQLSGIDQSLSDATGSLSSADQDVTHNEAGDASP